MRKGVAKTRLNIWHSAKPTRDFRGLLPMSPVDAKAWERTRELHPELYRKETAR